MTNTRTVDKRKSRNTWFTPTYTPNHFPETRFQCHSYSVYDSLPSYIRAGIISRTRPVSSKGSVGVQNKSKFILTALTFCESCLCLIHFVTDTNNALCFCHVVFSLINKTRTHIFVNPLGSFYGKIAVLLA